MQNFATSPTRSFVQTQLVSLIARHSRRIPLPVVVVDIVIAVLAYEAEGLEAALVWLLFALTVVATRWRMLSALPQRDDWSLDKRVRVVTLLSGLGGVVFGVSTAFFPSLPLPERAILTLLLLGLASGGVVTSGGHRTTYLAFAVPTVVPVAIMWLWMPGIDNVVWIERVIGLLVAMYLWILMGICRDNWLLFEESCSIRFRESELIGNLQSALVTADSANRAKTRFLAAASHDLRQPLHTLSMLAATLGLRHLDERSGAIVRLLNEVTKSLSEQLDGLLDISKLDAGIIQAEPRALRLSDLVRQHFVEIESLARAKQLTPRLQIASEAVVETDPQLLTRVLRNLTQNALRFTHQGEIVLRVERRDDRLSLEVEDTGCGIADEHQHHVFQEFYQVGNPERDRSKGLGLGLSIVRRLCELLTIELTMHSSLGKGTRFSMQLPLADVATALRHTAPVIDERRSYALCVLIVEDEKPVRLALRALLEELGCECLDASGTEAAQLQVAERRPDLVLADFRLRGSDTGLATIEAVCRRWPKVPAVLISGDTAPDRLQEAERAGVRLLHKPLSLQALRAELSAADESRRASCVGVALP